LPKTEPSGRTAPATCAATQLSDKGDDELDEQDEPVDALVASAVSGQVRTRCTDPVYRGDSERGMMPVWLRHNAQRGTGCSSDDSHRLSACLDGRDVGRLVDQRRIWEAMRPDAV